MATSTSSSKPLFKKPLFKKPAFGKAKPLASDADLFARADLTYVSLAAEEDARRQRKAARKSQENVRRRESTEPEEKRRRIIESDSDDEDEEEAEKGKDTLEQASAGEVAGGLQSRREVSAPSAKHTPSSSSKHQGIITPPDTKSPLANVVYINDDEDEDEDHAQELSRPEQEHKEPEITEAKATTPPALEAEEDYALSEDEAFPELARQAREKARRARLEAERPSPNPEPSQPSQPFQHSSIKEALSPAETRNPSQSTPETPPEPSVKILVSSPIPNTTPFIILRRLSQRLKDVRLAWCSRQGFTPEHTADIVLLWKDMRVFDVATCKSLGIGVDTDGSVVAAADRDSFDAENNRIHMTAMTKDMFEECRRARERELAKRHDEEDEDEEGEEAEETRASRASAEPQIRVTLRSKGLNDVKVLVKPVSFTLQNDHHSSLHSRPHLLAQITLLP